MTKKDIWIYAMINLVIVKLKKSLADRKKKYITNTKLVSSAVILPIFVKDDEYHILFIKRTETVKDHKGQISFPGGHFEIKDNSLLDTALRECEEEIGVPRSRVNVLGELDQFTTVTTGYVISTFVGLIPYPFDFKLDPREIDKIIEVPISTLLIEQNCIWKSRTGSFEYQYNSETIWGATAKILTQFLEIYSKIA
jgi:8-oxo-dGTP pyrophosphatase MutT (NUDIX family)